MGVLRTMALAPLSWIYGWIVGIRHNLFDWGVLRSQEFDIPIVCVGNLAVGGTGKTPHTEMLVEVLSAQYNVAVLSRGYKRRSKGFILSTSQMSYKRIGDEPKQLKLKFPNVPVAVCEKRTEGIRRLRELHPEVNLIILDDAFQHRYVEPWVNVVLMDYKMPVYEDHFLPLGTLRDQRRQLARANIVVVTKCPKDLRPLDYRIMQKNLELYPYQSLFFTTMDSDVPRPLFAVDELDGGGTVVGGVAEGELCAQREVKVVEKGRPVVAMCGIANSRYFLADLRARYDLRHTMTFVDHYMYKMRDIERLEQLLRTMPEETIVVVTEKDAVKLINSKKLPEVVRSRLYYVGIKVQFAENQQCEFFRLLNQYVNENQKYNIVHPE